MRKYALRYVPLLILVLLLIPLRLYLARGMQMTESLRVTSPYGPGAALYGVTSFSAGEAWAVGGSFKPPVDIQTSTKEYQLFPGSRSAPVKILNEPASGAIWHYIGGSWLPAIVNGNFRYPLFGVSQDSKDDAWAVGYGGSFVHYDGYQWTMAAGPAKFDQDLLGVSMLSSVNGWAVGYSGSLLHYDGKQWLQVTSPTSNDLFSIAMLSADEGWAVGDKGTILHYAHGMWSSFISPTVAVLRSVTMLSAAEGWAVGGKGTILHYRDGSWQTVIPAGFYKDKAIFQSADFYAVVMSSIHAGWLSCNLPGRSLLTYNHEVWDVQAPITTTNTRIVKSNGELVDTAPSLFSIYAIITNTSHEVWAVGSTDDGNNTNTLIMLHFQNNAWSVYSPQL